MSALVRGEDGVVYRRRPLSGLTEHADAPRDRRSGLHGDRHHHLRRALTTAALWRNLEPALQSLFADLGFHSTPAIELTYSLGLVLCVLLVAGVYRARDRGVRSVSRRYGTSELSAPFAHTLVPIGFAYVLAHYFSLLIWQGQAIGYLASDPLGNGANIFGTSSYQIDYTIISLRGDLVRAGRRARRRARRRSDARARPCARASIATRRRRSARSTGCSTVMVAFTSFGLWLLSAVGT